MPSTHTARPTNGRFRRFSVRFLFGLIAFSAAAMGFWKAFIYEPWTHTFPAYERAPSTQRLSAKVGPNTISIRSVARNDRDGNIKLETGHGKRLVGTAPGEKLLAACAPWLDVAQFELHPGPDQFEIIEARVFDHASHTLLSEADPAFGWQVVKPNLLQVYGFGKGVPLLVDIWLRVHSYHSDDRALTLAPAAGSHISIPGGTMTLSEIHDGFAGWSSRSGFAPVTDEQTSETALVLEWNGEWQVEQYQVAAVSVHGEKQFEDRCLNLGGNGDSQAMLMFDFPLDEIDHLQVRPHGGLHRFFFEAVRLPKTSGLSFKPPPTVRVPVDRRELPAVLPELAPLHVRMTVLQGDCVTGSRSNGLSSRLMMRRKPQHLDKAFTLTYDVRGNAALRLSARFQDSETGQFVPEASFRPRGGDRASGANHQISARTFLTPLDRVQAVEVSVFRGR